MRLLIISLLTLLAACGPSQPPQPPVQPPVYEQVVQPQQPIVVQQDRGMDPGTAAVLGGVVGYVAGQATAQPRYAPPPTTYYDRTDRYRYQPAPAPSYNSNNRTVVNNTTIVQQAAPVRVEQPKPVAPPAPPKAYHANVTSPYQAQKPAALPPPKPVQTFTQPVRTAPAPVARPTPAPVSRPAPAPTRSAPSSYKSSGGGGFKK